MNKVYEKAEVKVYELEMETSLLGKSDNTLSIGERIEDDETAGKYVGE